LSKLVDYEDTHTLHAIIVASEGERLEACSAATNLALSRRLHDPSAIRSTSKLFNEQTVICRENVGHWYLPLGEHQSRTPSFGCPCKAIDLPFQERGAPGRLCLYEDRVDTA
jgi:hypothetical protein